MNRTIGAIAVALLLVADPTLAVETGPYVGVFIARSHAEHLSAEELDESRLRAGTVKFESHSDTRNDDLLYNARAGVTAGWQFTRWLGLEGTFMLIASTNYNYYGEKDFAGTRLLTEGHITHALKVYSVSGVFGLPITNRFSLGARAGIAYSDAEVIRNGLVWEDGNLASAVDDDEKYSSTQMAPVFGANIEFTRAKFLTLRLDWHHFSEIGKVSATPRSIGYPNFKLDVYTFSGIWRF